MPAIITFTTRFDASKHYYYISLSELAEKFPHLCEGKSVELYLVELRNEQDRLIKRFKPFEELELETDTCWEYNKQILCLVIPNGDISRLNIGENYKGTIIVAKYDGKGFLPLEIKAIDYNAQKILASLSKIEAGLLSLSFEQPVVNKANSYLWNAHSRLEEGDVEGARMALRNCLQVLEDEILPNLIISKNLEESSEFIGDLKNLIKALKKFLHYGGPHPGPAPRTTTEMLISLTVELLKYLARALDENLVILKEDLK